MAFASEARANPFRFQAPDPAPRRRDGAAAPMSGPSAELTSAIAALVIAPSPATEPTRWLTEHEADTPFHP